MRKGKIRKTIDIPEQIAADLSQKAKENHRTFTGELVLALEKHLKR